LISQNKYELIYLAGAVGALVRLYEIVEFTKTIQDSTNFGGSGCCEGDEKRDPSGG
jgi:hypothetical protein